MYAAEGGHTNVYRLLIEAGADKDMTSIQNKSAVDLAKSPSRIRYINIGRDLSEFLKTGYSQEKVEKYITAGARLDVKNSDGLLYNI